MPHPISSAAPGVSRVDRAKDGRLPASACSSCHRAPTPPSLIPSRAKRRKTETKDPQSVTHPSNRGRFTAWPIAGAVARRLPVGSPARFPISTLSGLRLHGDPGRGGSQAACPVVSFRGTTFSR